MPNKKDSKDTKVPIGHTMQRDPQNNPSLYLELGQSLKSIMDDEQSLMCTLTDLQLYTHNNL